MKIMIIPAIVMFNVILFTSLLKADRGRVAFELCIIVSILLI